MIEARRLIDADDMPFTPAGDIAATNIQSAIEEVDAEKEKRTHRANTIYVGKHGNDSNDGLTPADAKLTFAGARAAIVTAADAAANNRYVIWCEDAGIYAEDLGGLAYVDIWAPRASINPINTHTVVDDMGWRLGRVTVPTPKTGFTKSAGSGKAKIRLAFFNCEGAGDGFLCSSGAIVMDVKKIEVVNGYGVRATGSSGEISGKLTSVIISGTGIGIGTDTAGAVFNLRIGNLEDGGSGTGIYIANVAATINLIASKISCGTAWNIAAAGMLNIHCPNVTGTQTETGTVNKVCAGVGIDNTPIGQKTPKAGAFTDLKASTDPVDEHGVGDKGFNDGKYLVFDEIIQAATDTLTATECRSKQINNYGQSAENTQTLPAATKGLLGRAVIATAGAGAFHLKAGASDKIYLDGVALDDGDKVSLATPVVGNFFSFFTFQNGATAYDWHVVSGLGLLIDGGV